jgi:hypothetical protein
MSDELNEAVKPVEVDINDLSLANEEVEVNSEADAFAGPPPPDDGDHRAKLKLGQRKVTAGKTKQGLPYFMVHIEATLNEPGQRFDGAKVFDSASSMVMQSSGTCRIAGILRQGLKETVPSRIGSRDLTKMLVDRLAGEPDTIVKTQWTAYCGDCKESGKSKRGIVLRAQSRFPQNPDGTHRHQLECPNCGSLLTARAEIVEYKSA